MSTCKYPFKDTIADVHPDFFASSVNRVNYILFVILLITYVNKWMDKMARSLKIFLSVFAALLSPHAYQLAIVFSYFFFCGLYKWAMFFSLIYCLIPVFFPRLKYTDEKQNPSPPRPPPPPRPPLPPAPTPPPPPPEQPLRDSRSANMCLSFDSATDSFTEARTAVSNNLTDLVCDSDLPAAFPQARYCVTVPSSAPNVSRTLLRNRLVVPEDPEGTLLESLNSVDKRSENLTLIPNQRESSTDERVTEQRLFAKTQEVNNSSNRSKILDRPSLFTTQPSSSTDFIRESPVPADKPSPFPLVNYFLRSRSANPSNLELSSDSRCTVGKRKKHTICVSSQTTKNCAEEKKTEQRTPVERQGADDQTSSSLLSSYFTRNRTVTFYEQGTSSDSSFLGDEEPVNILDSTQAAGNSVPPKATVSRTQTKKRSRKIPPNYHPPKKRNRQTKIK